MATKVIVFDVEHGACSFLRTPTNHTMLIDSGCTEGFSPALYIAENELPTASKWGTFPLTRMTVTHPHEDHISEIEAIKNYCQPAFLLRQKYDWEEIKAEEDEYEKLDIYAAWQDTYNGTDPARPEYGMTIQTFMLTPKEAKAVDETKFINNSSIVTVATVTGTKYQEKFLFGGDVETAGWDALLKKYPALKEAVKNVDFFIVPHHGHESGFSQALFDAMGRRPILNIVSIHHNDEYIDDRYGQEAYALGTKIDGEYRRMLTTRSDGTITINANDAGEFWVSLEHLADNKAVKIARYGAGGR
ncbi:MAG TPA: MBL fold metallo-hydrolase [Terriglobales bacterium]|nr:MBL fold metallo-hydrolase [Terriglobales bacterium]